MGRAVAVVFGAPGMLGGALVSALGQAGWQVAAAPTRSECDITDESAVRRVIAPARPDIVFNAAAYTNVDPAEARPVPEFMVNADAWGNVAWETREAAAGIVHYSTDFVF